MRLKALLIGLLLVLAPAAAAKPHKAALEPVVVELYTAQGCADCVKAGDLVFRIKDKPGVIALTFAVDYWDYLGWRDSFAKPEFGERQRAYMQAMKQRDVYTPQVVIDGARQVSALKDDEVDAAVEAALDHRAYQPDTQFLRDGRIAVGSGSAPRGGAVVWLVRYDPDPQDVEVKKGDNRGQTLRHGNVVRELVKLGPWRGVARVFRLPKAKEQGLKTVILVQSVRTGKIIAAKRQ